MRTNRNTPLFYKRDWSFGLILVLAVIVAYQPALRGEFVWDDDAWTTSIPGLLRDFSGLCTMWLQPTALQQYYPLTGTSFWIDHQLWGFWTPPYHVENILLHSIAALLFWQLLQRLQVAGAKLAGALFALHPLMVESVAWITERKNTLSLVFYLATLLIYGGFVNFWKEESPAGVAVNRSRRWSAYVLAFVLFLCAMLAKATAFSLPAVILLISWWKRGRIGWRANVLPLMPFFAFSIGFGLLTSWLEKHHVGATGSEWALSFPERCLIAGRVLWFYIGKLVCPVNLCFIYLQWRLDAASWWQWIYPVAAVGVLLGLWIVRNRIGRGPAAAAFYFVGTLFPVLGFMNVYFMRFSFVCDHWIYLSSLGLIALGASIIVQTIERLRRPTMLWGFAAVLLPVLAILTWRQSGMYTDMETLWRVTLAKNPEASLAHNNLGNILLQKGKVDEAIAHYRKAVEIKTDYADFRNNLGYAFLQKGWVEDAVVNFQRALQTDPEFSEAHNNLGYVLLQKGSVDDAVIHFKKALQTDPDYAEAHNNLGNALLQKGSVDDAITHYQKVLQLKPELAGTHYNLSSALLQRGRLDDAIIHFQRALQIKPAYAEAHNDLANVLLKRGRVEDAISHYRKALQFKPDYWEAQNNLAWVLSTNPQASLRSGNEAVALAQRANQLAGGENPIVLRTLGAACAEIGRFDDAQRSGRKAMELARAAEHSNLVEQLEGDLKLYAAGLPFHQESK